MVLCCAVLCTQKRLKHARAPLCVNTKTQPAITDARREAAFVIECVKHVTTHWAAYFCHNSDSGALSQEHRWRLHFLECAVLESTALL